MSNRSKPTARNRGGSRSTGSGGRPRNTGRQAPKSKPAQPVEPVLSTNPWRRRLERASAPVLLRLHYAPRWFLSVVMIGLLLLGLFVPGPVAAVFLLLVALMITWLLALSWPALTTGNRVMRLLIIGMLLFSALIRAAGLHVPTHH